MRAFLLLFIMVVLIPLAFVAPFAGILAFLWVGIVRPHEWAYSGTAQYSLAIGVATLLGYFAFEIGRRPPKIFPNIFMVLLWIQAFISTVMAYSVETSQPKFIEFTKIVMIGLLITTLTDTESRARWLLLAIIIAVGMLVLRSFGAVVVRLGNVHLQGPGGVFEDNNDYALLLNMALPLMFYFGRGEKKLWLRWGMYALALVTVIVIFFTYSRGGFLGLCAVGLTLALKSKYKITGVAAIAISGALIFAFLPDSVKDRLNTIKDAKEQDSSAQQRLRAWNVARHIISDHPFVGIGMKNMVAVFPKYGDPDDARVAHNSYLQIAVDAGLPALCFFLAMIAITFLRTFRARRILKTRAPDSLLVGYTHGLECSLVGYMVSGFFLSQYAFDILYLVAPLAASIRLMARGYEREAQLRDLTARSSPGTNAAPTFDQTWTASPAGD